MVEKTAAALATPSGAGTGSASVVNCTVLDPEVQVRVPGEMPIEVKV
jgi:hypothetical protein